MKEKIYTIPVTDAFSVDCECPMCVLEKKLEDESLDYYLGPSLMEPDHRIETNEKGFCRRHLELLYNKQENRLGLALMIDTHLHEQNDKLKKNFAEKLIPSKKGNVLSLFKNMLGKGPSDEADKTCSTEFIDRLIRELSMLESKCTICDKLDYTMDRYVDVILYLWFKEEHFREIFNNKKGFCLKHFRLLLEGAKKYLNARQAEVFTHNLLNLQLENMERLQQEVNWFTRKFDYRNNDAPWGNSKDALPRSIQKLVGFCNLK